MENDGLQRTKFLGIDFKNPVLAASGTFGFGEEYSEIFDVSILGGICSKGLTLEPKDGNKGMRIFETKSGMMNSIGLQNPGIKHFIDNELPFMEKLGTNVIVNLGGNTLDQYLDGIELLNDTDADIIELNISCPNVKSGGMAFGIKADIAYDVVSEVRKICKKPLMVKLSPNAENIVDMALACERAGADAVSLINTISALAVDINNRKTVFKNVYAGLSGPCVKPIALRMVHQVSKAVNIPVCGLGGISSWEDAIEFIMAGATLVQVGTYNFIKPDICLDIIAGIEDYMCREGIKSLDEIRGCL